MTVPTVVASVKGGPNTSSLTWSVTLPAGIHDGDMMVYFLGQLGGAAYTKDSHWTEYTGAGTSPYTNGTNTLQSLVFIEAVNAVDSGATRSISFGTSSTGKIVGYMIRGADTNLATFINSGTRAQATSATSKTAWTPAANTYTTTDGLVLVGLMARAFNGGDTTMSATPPSGYTEETNGDTAGAWTGATINGLVEVSWKARSGAAGTETPGNGAVPVGHEIARYNTITLVIHPGSPQVNILLSGGDGGSFVAKKGAKAAAVTLSGGDGANITANSTGTGGTIASEDFAGVPFGQDVTALNTIFSAPVLTASATIVGDTGPAVAIRNNSALVTVPIGGTASLPYTMSDWTTGARQWRWYLRRNVKPTGAACTHGRWRIGGTTIAQVSETTTGFFRFVDGTSTVVATSAQVTTDSEFLRIEVDLNRDTNTFQLDLYYGADITTNTPTQSLSGAWSTDPGGTIELRTGPSTALTNAMTARIDEWTYSNAGLPIGPATAEAHSGTFTLSGGATVAPTWTAKKGGRVALSALSTGVSNAFIFAQGTRGSNGYVDWDAHISGTGARHAVSPMVLSGGAGPGSVIGVKYLTARFGTFLESAGTTFDDEDLSHSKGGVGTNVILSGGGRLTGWAGKKGAQKSGLLLSGGQNNSFTGTHSEAGQGTLNLSGGSTNLSTMVGRGAHNGTFLLTGGAQQTFVGRKAARGVGVLLSGGATLPLVFVGAKNLNANVNLTGTIHLSGGGFIIMVHPLSHIPVVRLVWTDSIDDHVRPDHPLWGRTAFPHTQTALALYRQDDAHPNGQVFVVTTLWSDLAQNADYVVGGGSEFISPIDAWQVSVLVENGFALELVGG